MKRYPQIRRYPQIIALCAAAALMASAPGARAQAPDPHPDPHVASILAQLDAASQRFKSARADFVWDFYQAVVKDTSTQNGSIYFERTKSGTTQMGAVVLTPKAKPADKPKPDKVLRYKDGSLELLDVANDQIRVMSAGQNQTQYEMFLTLGFGGSGKDLARAWDIKYLGLETITDNGQLVKTEKLDLTSKDAGVRNNFTHVTIWVDPARGVSLRQVFDTPSHDRRTAVYTNIKLNTKIDSATFEIKHGPHTTVVR